MFASNEPSPSVPRSAKVGLLAGREHLALSLHLATRYTLAIRWLIPPPDRSASSTPLRSRIGPTHLLLGLSQHLEHQGLARETPPVALGAFQHARYFTAATARRFYRLASRCHSSLHLALVCPLSPSSARAALPCLSTTPCAANGSLPSSAHYAGALIAHDLADTGPDRDRRFAFILTHDDATVLTAARSLLDRVTTASSFSGLRRTDLPTPVATITR
jgi:hypothetical protein